MNKYQEALSEVIRMCAQSDELFPTEEIEALQELVDRATSKKPKENFINVYLGEIPSEKELHYYCQDCDEWVGDEWDKHKYCSNCGQLLDWELD